MKNLLSNDGYSCLWDKIITSYSVIDVNEVKINEIAIIVPNNGIAEVKNLIEELQLVRSSKIILICQPSMTLEVEKIVKDLKNVVVFQWEGKYTIDLVYKLEGDNEQLGLTGFLFWSAQEIHKRDINLYEIGYELNKKCGCETYSRIYDNKICHYHAIGKFCHGIRIYNSMEKIIDEYLDYILNKE